MGKWKSITDLNMPSSPGVYAIYFGDELVYVGSTGNLAHRIANHGITFARYSNAIETPWGRKMDVTIKVRQSDIYGDWAMHELRLIRRLQPRFNTNGVGKRDTVTGVGNAA